MKKFAVLSVFALAAIFGQDQANACAGCVDIEPVTINLTAEAAKVVVDQFQIPAKSSRSGQIGGIECSKKSEIWSDGTIQCLFRAHNGDKETAIELKGGAALDLLKKLDRFKGRIVTENEEGENVVAAARNGLQPFGEKQITSEIYKVNLNVHMGMFSCDTKRSAPRCELEIVTVTTSDFAVEL